MRSRRRQLPGLCTAITLTLVSCAQGGAQMPPLSTSLIALQTPDADGGTASFSGTSVTKTAEVTIDKGSGISVGAAGGWMSGEWPAYGEFGIQGAGHGSVASVTFSVANDLGKRVRLVLFGGPGVSFSAGTYDEGEADACGNYHYDDPHDYTMKYLNARVGLSTRIQTGKHTAIGLQPTVQRYYMSMKGEENQSVRTGSENVVELLAGLNFTILKNFQLGAGLYFALPHFLNQVPMGPLYPVATLSLGYRFRLPGQKTPPQPTTALEPALPPGPAPASPAPQ